MLLYEIEVLGEWRNIRPLEEISQPNKVGKKVTTYPMGVLSALAEKHKRAYLEITSEVALVPLDPSQQDWTIQLKKGLNPIAKDRMQAKCES